jgi:hypothetical protein
MKKGTAGLLFILGLVILFVSHLFMGYQAIQGIYANAVMTYIHVILNLLAGILIIFGKVGYRGK